MKIHVNRNPNPIGDDFKLNIDDNQQEMIRLLTEQKQANKQTTIIAIITLITALATLIATIIGIFL